MELISAGAVILVQSEVTDSVVRIERHSETDFVLTMSSRDNAGKMRIESVALTMNDLGAMQKMGTA
jgi:hypothetical protein